jgi:hypothetical protein
MRVGAVEGPHLCNMDIPWSDSHGVAKFGGVDGATTYLGWCIWRSAAGQSEVQMFLSTL